MSYLDTTRRTVSYITSQDPTSNQISASLGQAQGIYPIAGNDAVVAISNAPYLLHNSILSVLNTSTVDAPSFFHQVIATNPQQRSFVVAVNDTLYWYSSPDATPKKIITVSKQFDQMAYGGNNVIVYSTRAATASSSTANAYASYAIHPILIDLTTKSQTVLSTTPIVDASIAPDGAHAAITPLHETTTTLYDLARHTTLYDLQASDVISPLWVQNNQFIYSKGSDLWDFDMSSRIATAIGSLPADTQATSLTYDTSTNTYLATTYQGDTDTAIYRLSATADSGMATQAVNVTGAPVDNPLFSLKYLNITQPTIAVTTNILAASPTLEQITAGTALAQSAASQYLTAHGINPQTISVVYIQAPTQ